MNLAISDGHSSFPRMRESRAAGLQRLLLDPRFRGGDLYHVDIMWAILGQRLRPISSSGISDDR
jgi:hypothetical protein